MKNNYQFVFYLCLLILLPDWVVGQNAVSKDVSKAVEAITPFYDLHFTESERDSLIAGMMRNLESYEMLHQYAVPFDVIPALLFNPVPIGFTTDTVQQEIQWNLPQVKVPENPEALTFYSVAELSVLIKTKQISSLQLTTLYLARLKQYSDTLACTITLLEQSALDQAKKADEEIAAGHYRGPLHGIPYGIKDLLAVEGTKTTWGAAPFRDQVLKETATIARKLNDAGAILVAKLSMGALAMGDVWFGGTTKNPWNLQEGSSGSSAGSAAATSAGLVAFAIGTETLGSIVSPSTRCGVTGLRSSYGRVSRTGAMTLSWSMDKIGPICRTAQDCALVFEVIRGKDEKDPTLMDVPFNYRPDLSVKNLKIGYLKSLFDREYENKSNDQASLKVLEKMGAKLEPVELPDNFPIDALRIILGVESAAAFDELTRSDRDSLLVRQDQDSWPNYFRNSRLVPAVEYVQANRVRFELIQEMYQLMKNYDAIVSPSFGGDQLLITNLTGTPCVVVPNGFNTKGSPTSITFLGNLFDEATILSVADAYQKATEWDEKFPPYFSPDLQSK